MMKTLSSRGAYSSVLTSAVMKKNEIKSLVCQENAGVYVLTSFDENPLDILKKVCMCDARYYNIIYESR